MRVTLVRGRLRVVEVSSSGSSSRVLGGREAGFLLVVDEGSVELGGVRSGLMSLVTGGLVLVIVPVVVDVDDSDVVVAENAGST